MGRGIVTLGYALSHIPLVKRYEDQVMTALILLPIILLISGLIGMAVVVWRKKRAVA